MLTDAGLKMMELAGRGYCCSQMMVLLALDEMGRENPDLVRSAAGLCDGMGDCSGPCGIFSGAAIVLGLYAGKGTDREETSEILPLMMESFRNWFVATTTPFGGTTCHDILDGDCGQPNPIRCGGLLGDAYEQVRVILTENRIDPAEGREIL